ncbi:MAG: InlB B-repeat-containing protein [Acholeplasmatales bacterium]|jgi:uncharacterized repeat protein (TIGR02543 family)|nr:InlB B-repeat-containing protein [Acholeplasmatales bacterium]
MEQEIRKKPHTSYIYFSLIVIFILSAAILLYSLINGVVSHTVTFNTFDDLDSLVIKAPITSSISDKGLDNPSRDGYTFNGWYTEKEYVNLFSNTKRFDKDYNLYAKWELQEYTITYDLPLGAYNSINNPKSYNIESSYILLYEPVFSGHNFLGWYYTNYEGVRVEGISRQEVLKDIVLYAYFD